MLHTFNSSICRSITCACITASFCKPKIHITFYNLATCSPFPAGIILSASSIWISHDLWAGHTSSCLGFPFPVLPSGPMFAMANSSVRITSSRRPSLILRLGGEFCTGVWSSVYTAVSSSRLAPPLGQGLPLSHLSCCACPPRHHPAQSPSLQQLCRCPCTE